MRLTFGFCCKRMKTIQTMNITMMFIPLKKADNFLLQDNTILLHLESVKE